MDHTHSNPGQPALPRPAAPLDTVSEAVGLFASQRGLGQFVDVRRGDSRTAALLKGWGTAVVGAVLLWLTATLGEHIDPFSFLHSLVRFVGWFFMLMCVWGFVYGFRGLVTGSQAFYLFDGGLVHSRGTRLNGARWSEIVVLKSIHGRGKSADEGKTLGYQVRLADNTSFAIPLVLEGGRDAFIDRIVDRLRHHGRPID